MSTRNVYGATRPGAAPGPPRTYATLTETDGKRKTTNCYFIRWEGNQEALHYLQSQLEEVRYWFPVDDDVPIGSFKLDLNHLVSATTAEEMSRLVTNEQFWCTRLDGKMRTIDFGFREDPGEMARRVYNKIGFGRVGKFLRGAAESRGTNRGSPGARSMSPGSRAAYVVYVETDGGLESSCYFIRREGNEETLRHLQIQLEQVSDWFTMDREGNAALPAAFGLDLDHPVSTATVEEMLKVEGNGYTWCAKLDSEMRPIDLGFTRGELLSDEAISRRVSSVIGHNGIERFFSEPVWAPGPAESYAVLLETADDHRNHYWFIRIEGNEQALYHLQGHLKGLDSWLGSDGVFALDLDHPVSPATVAGMLRVRTNRYTRCARLDGKMDRINFGFTLKDRANFTAMARKMFGKIGYGGVRRFFK